MISERRLENEKTIMHAPVRDAGSNHDAGDGVGRR